MYKINLCMRAMKPQYPFQTWRCRLRLPAVRLYFSCTLGTNELNISSYYTYMFFSFMTEVNFIPKLFVKWLLQNNTGYFKFQWCLGYQLSSSMKSTLRCRRKSLRPICYILIVLLLLWVRSIRQPPFRRSSSSKKLSEPQ